nr:PIG-L family deacetylase [Oscillatoria sp. FACHB-1406]
MLFSPHPDDECLTGALPLRLLREGQFKIINIAITLGSKKERQQERWQELQNACNFLGFETIVPAKNGLEAINPSARQNNPQHWNEAVEIIADILAQYRPPIIFCPHEGDKHPTHIGTHYLVMDALQRCSDFCCCVVETEFWGAMESPNLMVESSCEDVADLMAATACHVGEVQRNPYHLRLPAWMADNVRRGGELVGGAGARVPDFSFATLYRQRYWAGGSWKEGTEGGEIVAVGDELRSRFF